MKIIKDNNPLLRRTSETVELPLSKEDSELLDQMLNYLKLSQDEEYSKKHNIRAGVGLAAPQIGILKKMFVIYYKNEDGKETKYELVNPKIIETSVRKCALNGGEGCLSVEKPYEGLVHRNFKIKMIAYDNIQKKDVEIVARGYDSVVLQHEYDHLDGILFYDRINKANPNEQLDNEQII